VLVFALGPRMIRAVTHLDVTREQCERAAEVLAEAGGGGLSRRPMDGVGARR
jgi:hypothetical protein